MPKNSLSSVKNLIPEIYCSLSIMFAKTIDMKQITTKLHEIGIENFDVCFPKTENVVVIDIAAIRYERMWHIGDALTQMFARIDSCITELKTLVDSNSGEICIDISFYHYGTYPSLLFAGDNMKKIRFLEADISIDPYWLPTESVEE